MSQPQTPWREPIELSAGDTLAFERRLPEYLATDGWYLDYEIRCGSTPSISFQSTADGDAHSVTVLPAVTALWPPGPAIMYGYAVLAPNRFRIYYGELTIYPNGQTQLGDAPIMTFAQQMVANIEAVLLGTASVTLLESRIGDTQFKYMSAQQLAWQHGYWRGQRRQEIAHERAKAGLPTGNAIRPIVRVMQPGRLTGGRFSIWR